jgi:hypothetical protein
MQFMQVCTAARRANSRLPVAAVVLVLALTRSLAAQAGEPPTGVPASPNAEAGAVKVQALVRAYPEFLAGLEGNELVWKDGTRMVIDDGRGAKEFETLLDEPDIKDQFAFAYVPGRPAAPPRVNEDPGRVRYMALFDKMYGDCRKGETERNLVDVAWLPKHGGGKVRVTRINGVAERLARVSAELDELPERFMGYLKPHSGTYNCRVIAKTTRVSAHGHGIAIDINSKASDYWQWTKPDADGRYVHRSRVPYEIVEVFERHGFIWGGKWYHFDTMHFEYRPELLAVTE